MRVNEKMHLIIHPVPASIGILSTLTSSMSDSTSSSDTTLQTISAIANIVYAGLTVVIVIVAILSLALARKQMNQNNKQSEATLAASTRQSQAAIDAVHNQIIASEKHSQAAIDAVHKQIEASERQTRETIYNQHRPILVCPYHPIAETSLINIPLPIKNVGLGIALNIRGVLSYRSATRGEKLQLGFIIPSVLTPDDDREMISFNPQIRSTLDNIGEYSFFPEDNDSSYNQRLVITYLDIFNRKHLSIFDGRLGTNWKLYILKSDFKYGIEDVCTDWMLLGRA